MRDNSEKEKWENGMERRGRGNKTRFQFVPTRPAQTTNSAYLEQTHEIAGEYMSPWLSPGLIQQLSTPPSILWCIRHSDDIPSLEIEFLVNDSRVVIQRFHCSFRFLFSFFVFRRREIESTPGMKTNSTW